MKRGDGLDALCDALKAHVSDTLLIGVVQPPGRVLHCTFDNLADALDWAAAVRGPHDVLFLNDRRCASSPDFVDQQRFSALFGRSTTDA